MAVVRHDLKTCTADMLGTLNFAIGNTLPASTTNLPIVLIISSYRCFYTTHPLYHKLFFTVAVLATYYIFLLKVSTDSLTLMPSSTSYSIRAYYYIHNLHGKWAWHPPNSIT